MRKILSVALLTMATLLARTDSVVVFNEINYHPATNEALLEWVELHNQLAVDVDMSGWSIRGGIDYDFPEGTVMPGDSYLVVALSPFNVTAFGLTNVVGPFTGRLSNSGEELRLRNNNGRVVDSVAYSVEDKWPVAPDGAGPTLTKFDPDSASAVPGNWRASTQIGGTPGRVNFPRTTLSTTSRTLIPIDATWRYEQSGAELGTAWRAAAYNDSGWSSGQALLAQEDCACLPEPIRTGLTTGATKTNFYFRTAFNYTGSVASAALSLRHVVDDGLIVYLNGNEIWRFGLPTGVVDAATFANRSVDNAIYEGPFSVPATGLIQGTNVLAVEVHQNAVNSSDVAFGLQLDNVTTTTNVVSGTNSPLQISFNEVSSVSNAQFGVEIVNQSTQTVVLDNYVLARFGNTNREYIISGSVPPGGYFVLDRATLGFGADPGDQVVLYSPGKTNVIDAVLAKDFARARWPEGTGEWLRPSAPTPGSSNIFAFHDEIVINEIMYQARALPGMAAVYFTNTLISITNEWRYEQTRADLPPSFAATNFDDSTWPLGGALFYTNFTAAQIPVARGSTIQLSNTLGQAITTYYFRTPFVYTNVTQGVQLTLNPLVDDGAVFYLNGVEIYRYNMPTTNPITFMTRAITNIGIPTFSGPVVVPASSLLVGTNILAVSLHNALPPPGSRDVAFGVELTASGFVLPPVPARESTESWLELFNRSTNAVALGGWELADGIDYQFPTNTIIPAGGYLVVAKDMALMQEKYPTVAALGPFSGSLSRGGERILLKDAMGNPADEVSYFDGNPWPSTANGGGSSLELRDPRADNSKPGAWAASEQSGQSGWQTYTYRGFAAPEPAASPTQWNEFIMGLLGEGEVWLDDVSVIESPNGLRRQLLQNGRFENGLAAWRTIGTLRRSEVIVDPLNAANHILRLVATGDTEHRHNQASTTLTNGLTIVNGTEYEISFRAKWISGNNKLNTRLYFNRLAHTTDLTVPETTGTPSAINSRAVANVGPTFSNLRHAPVVPTANESVVVTAESGDPDSVASATLFYSVNGGSWQNAPMTISNLVVGKALKGTIPTQGASSLVQFYISATDGLGATALYPAGGANSRALYKVSNGQALNARLHNIRLLMNANDVSLLHAATNVMSNEPWPCTVVYDDREVFYDTTLHLQASERGRNDATRVGFTVKLPTDHLLKGVHDGFTLDRSGGYSGRGGKHDEILLKHAVNKAGDLPGMYDDIVQVFAPSATHDGTALLLTSKYDDDFLDSAFQDGGDGEMYKLELIYYPTTTANADPQGPKLPQPDGVVGTDIRGLGNDPDQYRWTFLKENHGERDNYEPMMNLAKTMDLTGTNFDTQIKQVMDVDEWLRAVAFITIIGGTDIYTYGNSHNLNIYFRPDDGKAMAFLWDMDFSFTAAVNAAFPGTGSPNTSKLFANPDFNRRYYNHLYDLTGVTGDSAYMTRWANHYAGLVGQNWSAAVDFLVQRAAFVRSQMPLATAFSILNNGGNNFATSSNTIVLSGSAPMSVRDVEINGIRYALTWTSLTNWTLTLPLPAFTNLIAAQGYDAQGRQLTNATDSITVTNLAVPAAVPVVINEWMADDAGPGGFADPIDNQFQDWFELYNPNNSSVNLSGYFLTDTLAQPTKWTIPTNTIIAPHGFLLVWADEDGTQNGMGTNGDLHANFKLSAGGEALGLFAPDGTPQHTLTFGAQFQNVSQGLFPDGNTNSFYFMTNWTPRASNRLTSAATAPALGAIVLQSNNHVTFTFTSTVGLSYRIEYKDSLTALTWQTLRTQTATNAVSSVEDDIAANLQRFYRVSLLP